MTAVNSTILTLNGGSSSIKFALFDSVSLSRILAGSISGIGQSDAKFTVKGRGEADSRSQSVKVADYAAAIEILIRWTHERGEGHKLLGVGHRVVHGGPTYSDPQRLTADMLAKLRKLSPFDSEHLPQEILLIEAFQREFPDLPQIACFDTAFHRTMPRVAYVLPIPRRYESQGVRRYGFHGLSYTYLMQQLRHLAGAKAANGRVVLAHLGSGASMAAVRDGVCVDTTMAFTPTAGLVMGSRSGDLDPGIANYLARTEGLRTRQIDHMFSHESGLLGVSETSSDMQVLLAQEKQDIRAAEAVELFCYQARKWIGAYSAVLGGLDTVVFAGGIGENSAVIRARICSGLAFLGIEIDEARNAAHRNVISSDGARTTVCVIPTNEELIIAQSVSHLLALKATDTEA
jgi:acetate kinase